MRRHWFFIAIVGSLLFGPGRAAPAAPQLKDLEGHRRVLILATPEATDPQFLRQQRALAEWTGGDERDVTVVRVEGEVVLGSSETAKALRDRYRLAARQFSAVLIGKDGHVALRSATALSGAQLEAAIDAMPMRKSGLR